MPTFIVDARATTNKSDDIVELDLSYNLRQVQMTARRSWTLEQLAQNILAQSFPDEPDKTFQLRFTIDAHQEVVEGTTVWVVDSVTSEQLLDEAASDGIANMPGWATWDADQAADWIDENVVDLDSAKTALTALARMVVYLRDRYVD